MITIKELKEFNKLAKKDLNFKSVGFRYHNKNNTGGNFAINYIISEFGKPDFKDYELEGTYKTDFSFRYLKVGIAYRGIGTNLNLSLINSINDLLTEFKKAIEQEEKLQEFLRQQALKEEIINNLE